MDRRRAKSWFVAVAVALAALSFANAAFAIQKCGSGKRITCVVDGDTMWLRGEKIRMKGYDTPETTTQICGGAAEVALGNKATDRVVQLLSDNKWTIKRFGKDKYGRTLATIRVGGKNIGRILIKERLARSWPNGREFWCK